MSCVYAGNENRRQSNRQLLIYYVMRETTAETVQIKEINEEKKRQMADSHIQPIINGAFSEETVQGRKLLKLTWFWAQEMMSLQTAGKRKT